MKSGYHRQAGQAALGRLALQDNIERLAPETHVIRASPSSLAARPHDIEHWLKEPLRKSSSLQSYVGRELHTRQ